MKYRNIVIDPPWPKEKGGIRAVRPNQNRALDYPVMSIPDIFNLLDTKIFNLADEDGHNIFLWAIDKFLKEAELGMEERGYKRHARFIWNKMNGVAPAFTVRYCHEYLIWFYKPKLLAIDKNYRGKFGTIIEEKAREHSRKPDSSYELIDKLYPGDRKFDVFSREKRIGWDQFGNQVTRFNAKKVGRQHPIQKGVLL